jgi:hypothetical protein
MIEQNTFRDNGGYRGWRVTAAAFTAFSLAWLCRLTMTPNRGDFYEGPFGIDEDRLEG